MVLAGSFSETFKRNALNNGLVCLEAPDLVHDLKKWHQQVTDKKLTERVESVDVTIHYDKGLLEVSSDANSQRHLKSSYRIPALGRIAQELIMEDGLENWIRRRANNQS